MTPKKKKSLDKKLKTQVTKYENDLEKYLDDLDDAKRCKYDEVKFVEVIFYNYSRFKFSWKWKNLVSGSLNGWKMSQKHRFRLILITKGMVTRRTDILRSLVLKWYKVYISNLNSKVRDSRADEFSEMSMVEQSRALGKMWREISAEQKNKVIKSFEKVYQLDIIFHRIHFRFWMNKFSGKRKTRR